MNTRIVLTTRDGTPLAVTLTEANQHDLRQLLALLMLKFPHVGGVPGRPLDRPLSVMANKGVRLPGNL